MNRLSVQSQKYHKRNRACWYCGIKVALDPKASDSVTRMATVDHQMPRSRGGSNARTNRVTACIRCNHDKGKLTLEEYRTRLAQQQRHAIIFYGERTGFVN